MGVLLSFCGVKLFLAKLGEIFAEGVLHILLGEEDADACERSIIGSHAVVFQGRNGLHALLRHILLSENLGEFLGTVVAEIDEDNHVALFNNAVYCRVMDRFDELVGNTFIITFLHGLHHVLSLFALSGHDEVVGFLHTLPALVTVHGIEAAYDAGNGGIILSAAVSHLLNETFTRLRVCITAIHETMNEHLILQSELLTHLDELEKMVKAGMHATVGGQSHEVKLLTVLLGVVICFNNTLILQDRTILACTVDLHKVLVNNTSGTDIEVSNFRVTHLSVGQTHVLARSRQL